MYVCVCVWICVCVNALLFLLLLLLLLVCTCQATQAKEKKKKRKTLPAHRAHTLQDKTLNELVSDSLTLDSLLQFQAHFCKIIINLCQTNADLITSVS